ncbi:PUA-like domain-containing protein [Tirmania nivea]|nr:PUA-like domain-containing protein [Tirmania nivea]
MEGGKAIKTELGDEVIDLDRIQSSKRSIPELWETATPAVKDLIHCRYRLQRVSKSAAQDGLSPKDALETKSILDKLSTFPFEGNSFNDTKIAAAVKLVTKPEVFGDIIARRATSLRGKWKSGDFSPEPFLDDEDQPIDSSDDEEYETSGTEAERAPCCRGPENTTSSQGERIYTLDPRYTKKPADVFGHNGLRVGDWWPFQTFALKDGAHGSKMGGIYGRTNLGAFSVVVSGGIYEENDFDNGDRILYSGSKGGSEEDATSEAPYTNATRSLVVSTKHNKPVRVLRSSRNNSRWSPSAGIRYDGLYNVESYTIKTDGERKKFYQFVLVRLQDQSPIDRTRPTAVEVAALDRIKNM